MALLGLFLMVTGFMLNIAILRRAAGKLSAAEILRSPPWALSLLLVVAGLALLLFAPR